MKIGILGTGMVGKTLGTKLVACGHEVRMGAREAANEAAAAWASEAGPRASTGTFADASAFGEVVFLCVLGEVATKVVQAAGDGLAGKVLVDLTNPLDFSEGMPPKLFTSGGDSLGKRVQAAAPQARVVKTLNTVSCNVMIDPASVPGDHGLFVCGDDADAKAKVVSLLREDFGWRTFHDLGPLAMARCTEGYLPLWVSLYGLMGTDRFNVAVQKGG